MTKCILESTTNISVYLSHLVMEIIDTDIDRAMGVNVLV